MKQRKTTIEALDELGAAWATFKREWVRVFVRPWAKPVLDWIVRVLP